MKLRLGFSVVAHTASDIFVLDETLAVGDQDFQKKSFNKIKEFFAAGKTIIIVSHNLGFLKVNCDRIIWLDNGRIKQDGSTKRVIGCYGKDIK